MNVGWDRDMRAWGQYVRDNLLLLVTRLMINGNVQHKVWFNILVVTWKRVTYGLIY